ncbi:MAG: APC family permease [Candidatus Thermoplasmatota archaeon]
MEETAGLSYFFNKLKRKILGYPRNLRDPNIFHKISLIALLSWIGLGADGLSSSSYGPEEAYRVLITEQAGYLAVFLALATALTVFIISYTYSKIIERFPHGGGGYVVATHTLGKNAGVISGSALLVDYVLTITVSIAACGDAIFSFLPPELQSYRLLFKIILILMLILLNIRGIKESITILAPIFILFIMTHILLLGYGILSNVHTIGMHLTTINTELQQSVATIGFLGVFAIFLRAFSFGSGTYTGIEAVSNGIPIMREPKVKTAKRTMMYMALSLAIVAGSLLLCYYFLNIQPREGQTLNAVLATTLFRSWPYGDIIAFIIIFSEGLLLLVASQTGFIDGPRVMANMATDSWLPRKFAALSEQLTMRNGVLVMGGAALLLMIFTDGQIDKLVIMYSINVFLTFSLSQLGMTKLSYNERKKKKNWKRHFFIFLVGFIVCFTILMTTMYEKTSYETERFDIHDRLLAPFTLAITSCVIIICYFIRRHYDKIQKAMKKFDDVLVLSNLHLVGTPTKKQIDPKKRTAVLFVNGYTGFGVNTFLSLIRNFPNLYKNIIFVSVAEINSGTFKGIEELEALQESVQISLQKYVNLARKLGYPADYRMDVGTDVVETASKLCEEIAKEFPSATFFSSKLVFRHETILHKLFHNETAFAIQRRLQWKGLTTVIIPIRIDI